MQQPIFVKTNLNTTLVLYVDIHGYQSISEVKHRLQDLLGIPVEQQRIFFGGTQLYSAEDNHGNGSQTLQDYGVAPDSTLNLTVPLLGGPGGVRLQVQMLGKSQTATSVEVSPTDKIVDLKRKIQEKLSIPMEEQELGHGGLPLDDDQLVYSFEFGPDSLIHLIVKDRRVEEIEIFIHTPTGTRVPMTVARCLLVEQLKCLIEQREGISPTNQSLVYGNHHLETGKQLADYDVVANADIHLEFPIFIHNSTGGKLEVAVTRTLRVEQLKSLIHQHKGLPPEKQSLVFLKSHLEDGKQLSEYGILPGSDIYLEYQIFIVTPNEKKIALTVSRNLLVEDFKLMIQSHEAIPPEEQRIVIGNHTLEDGYRLEDYDVLPDNCLRMWVRLEGGVVILVEAGSGKTISLNVQMSDTSASVKTMIATALNLPVDKIFLTHAGRPLEDDKTVGDYEIQENSRLHLIVKVVGGCSLRRC